jgi:hypothetical protein
LCPNPFKVKNSLLPPIFLLGLVISSCQKKDTIPPYIRLNGAADTSIVLNTRYVDPGAFSKDETDAELEPIQLGYINKDSVGVYTLTYVAVDNSDNRAEVTRTIRVINDAQPYAGLYSVKEEITIDDITTTSEYNLDLIVSNRQNNRMIISNLGGYTSINALIEMRDTSVALFYQERFNPYPGISKVIIHGGEGKYTTDGFRLQFVTEEIDTSAIPKRKYQYCVPVYTRKQ